MAVESAEALTYGKPHPEVYLNCAAALEVDPRYCLAIEDSFNGLIAARAANIHDRILSLPRGYDSVVGEDAQLSGGERQRVSIARAVLLDPPILVLDEPTAGVDVDLRRQLWELVSELNRDGVTVVLTTHYLEEAEELCDRIAIINHGQLIANKPTRELVDMAREKIVTVTAAADLAAAPAHDAFVRVEWDGARGVEVTYDKDKLSAGQVLAILQEQGLTIEDVTTREADLEDVFVQLTGAG